MSEPHFLDSNVPLRFFTQSDPAMAEFARVLLARVEDRAERVAISLVVVLELVFTLERAYKRTKEQIRAMVHALISLPNVQLADKHLCFEALDGFVDLNI